MSNNAPVKVTTACPACGQRVTETVAAGAHEEELMELIYAESNGYDGVYGMVITRVKEAMREMVTELRSLNELRLSSQKDTPK